MSDTKGPVNIEVFVAVNEEGDYAVTTDESDALETLANEQGGWHARVIRITLRNVELPGQDDIEIDAPKQFQPVALPAASAEDTTEDTTEATQ